VEGFRVDGTGEVGVLTIDRPAKRNALTRHMWQQLPGILDDLRGAFRVLVVTGAGDTFSSGADIAELQDVYGDAEHARAYHNLNVIAEAALAAFPQPTIASIAGSCVGGGLQLALACDIRIAQRDARFGLTPAKLGVIYPSEPTLRLAGLVGPARAKYLLMSAELIDAAQALAFGLVEEVTDDTGRALTLAGIIAGRSPRSIAAARDVITNGRPTIEHEPSDVPEGLGAFLERRAANFRHS
jgi:enoyl-CoA hydratase/carnithine racemase